MSSSYRKTVDKLNEQSGGDNLPCMGCQTQTQRSVLSHLGARCQSCYEAYCREPPPELHPKFRGMPGGKTSKLDLSLPKRADIDRDKAKAETARLVAHYAEQHRIDAGPINRAKDGQPVARRDIDNALRASGDMSSLDEPAWIREDLAS